MPRKHQGDTVSRLDTVMAGFTTQREEAVEVLAVVRVRRECNQHRCTDGPQCEHPNHRRDVDYLRECLSMLGLLGKSFPTS